MNSFHPHPAFIEHQVKNSKAQPRFRVGQTIDKLTIIGYLGYSKGHPVKGTILHAPMHWYECRDVSGEYCIKTQQQLKDSRRERTAGTERKQQRYAKRLQRPERAGVSRPVVRGYPNPLQKPTRPLHEL